MIPVFRPSIRRADMDAVLTRLAEDSIGAGELAREFSGTVARYLGRRSGVSMRTFRQGLSAAVAALALERGSRVGCSVLASRAVRYVLEDAGYTVVPLDTQRNLPLLPSPLDCDYQARDLAALLVDTRLGYVADLESLRQLQIPLIEDVSEGLGGNTGSVMAGSVGDVTLACLEPQHIVTAGGGAVVVTNSTRRAAALQAAVAEELGAPPLPDMNAALGLTQMKQLERFIERRRDIAGRMIRVVQRTSHGVPLQGGDGENVFFALPVVVNSSPRDVEQYARGHGVTVVRAFEGTILEEMGVADEVTEGFPNALSLASRMVLFPLYPSLATSEQERIERVLATMP